MQIIDNQTEFEELCQKLQAENIIYIDTEFCRRRTYHAQLSLLQIAAKNIRVIVDALSVDVNSFQEILSNQDICKVLHAPDQDFDIFYHKFKTLPKNVFDTQIAAGVVGMDPGIGYGNLCKMLLYINLDKTNQKANWLKRPLTKSLAEYAIKDVEYLIPLHRELSSSIGSRKLWDAYHSRCAKLLDSNSYKPNYDKIVSKILYDENSDKLQSIVKELVVFRENCASQIDVPRNHAASDYELKKIAKKLPNNENDLIRLGVSGAAIARGKFRKKLIELCIGMKEISV